MSRIITLAIDAFKHGDEPFVVKAVAICEVPMLICHAFLFKPPYPWCDVEQEKLVTYGYQRNTLHGLAWDDGVLPYRWLPQILREVTAGKVIYVKGAAVKDFLTDLLPPNQNIINVEQLEIVRDGTVVVPSLQDVSPDLYTVGRSSAAARSLGEFIQNLPEPDWDV